MMYTVGLANLGFNMLRLQWDAESLAISFVKVLKITFSQNTQAD